jgi:hypothetical protein
MHLAPTRFVSMYGMHAACVNTTCTRAPQVLVKHGAKLQMGRTQTAEMLCACVSNSDLVQLT